MKSVAPLAVLLIAQCFPPVASAGCRLVELAELPVTMNGLRPTVTAQINGSDAVLILDTGAFYSMLTAGTAAQLKLPVSPAGPGLGPGGEYGEPRITILREGLSGSYLEGIGGGAGIAVTHVNFFRLFNTVFSDVQLIVGGSEPAGAMGILGQDFLRIGRERPDVEYDFANGALRLMHPEACRGAALAYWAKSLPYSVIDVDLASPISPHTTGAALLNGVKIRVMFDTGAERSVVSLGAAERAGVRPGNRGVLRVGLMYGLGRRPVRAWSASFASFKLGDEEVRNTRLRIADIGPRSDSADMLIGTDFFLAHRIYVARSQRKLYFTYNGGPVFDLDSPRSARASEVSAPAVEAGEPTGAEGFALRGAAFAARREFARALADLTRACDLAPNEPSYFYQRGLAHWGNAQPSLAMADFDRALELEPNDVPALVTRAELHLAEHDAAAARSDLNAADRSAPPQADVRRVMGGLYLRLELFAAAVAQYDSWIAAHAQDARSGEALSGRCRAQASAGIDLERALADCNAALELRPGDPDVLNGRGIARLRLGRWAKAMADFDAVLRVQPQNAGARYGRGIGELRRGMTRQGRADIAAAAALQPRIAEQAGMRGLVP